MTWQDVLSHQVPVTIPEAPVEEVEAPVPEVIEVTLEQF